MGWGVKLKGVAGVSGSGQRRHCITYDFPYVGSNATGRYAGPASRAGIIQRSCRQPGSLKRRMPIALV